MTMYYLRSNTVAEPMINRWYAWPMLISPATSALIISNSYIKILNSYINMPKMHEAAVENVKMRGGPFVDFKGKVSIESVKNYLGNLQQKCSHILAFAKALSELNDYICKFANGHSMETHYENIPDILRGYIELIYDANNNPGYRLLESLLYQSNYYNKDGQEIKLSTIENDYRSFVLSTPRLQNDDSLVLKMSFDNSVIDRLFSTREYGIQQKELEIFFEQYFPNSYEQQKLFWSFFTTNKPKKENSQYTGDGIRIRYFGHACVLIETKDTNILIDCCISYKYQTDISRFTFDELPDKIDYVLLTHSHQDHVLFEHLLQLRYKIINIVVPKSIPGAIQDPSLKLMFKHLNFKNVIEIDELDTISLLNGEIVGIPFFGEHGDLYINTKLAYLIQLNDKKLFFAADSNNLEPMLYSHLHKIYPKFDVIFLGMECDGAPMTWLYGPILGKNISRQMDQSRRLNGSDSDKAMDIIKRFDCKEVYIYAMGQEPWLGYITSIEYTKESRPITESDRVIELCRIEQRFAERLYACKEVYIDCKTY